MKTKTETITTTEFKIAAKVSAMMRCGTMDNKDSRKELAAMLAKWHREGSEKSRNLGLHEIAVSELEMAVKLEGMETL